MGHFKGKEYIYKKENRGKQRDRDREREEKEKEKGYKSKRMGTQKAGALPSLGRDSSGRPD